MRLSILLAVAALATAPPAAHAATAAGMSKMKACGGEWRAMSDADRAKYNDRAKAMKSKKGRRVSGLNAWTSECMRK